MKDAKTLYDRIHGEMIDSFDEELEELDVAGYENDS
jgi:hypothetical protein